MSLRTEEDRVEYYADEQAKADAVAKLLGESLDSAHARIRELEDLINTPKTDDFLEGVKLEAAHQVERWGSEHDAGKEPQSWFWLLGYLSGKALGSVLKGDTEKALHHTVSSAAVLLNWHRSISGAATAMRPGIEPPKEEP